jgi:hypothetical protein
MNNFYIYTSKYEKKNQHEEKVPCSVTVIFCDRETIEDTNLQAEIKLFYQNNYQTDEIFVIGGEYNKVRLKELFIEKQLEIFKDIPKPQREHLANNIYLFTFNKDGHLECNNKPNIISQDVIKIVINEGLVNVFTKRGGLIEAKGDAHHFVFPSGKHCNKFLRTGNILLHTSEIYFIAFNLLSHFKETEHTQIFCDTSSINTLAFALLELKRKLTDGFKLIPVESFSSYDGLFAKSIKYFGKSLILISSSTSANIIERIIKHDDKVDKKNIVILFFLGKNTDYSNNKSNIICNLTKYEKKIIGVDYYNTYTERDCIYCKAGSYAVEVKGDIFLLEKPKINRVTINITDAPKKLSNFVRQFKSENKTNSNVFKVNYKENTSPNNKYEVYFDMFHVLSVIEKNEDRELYKEYREKLFDYINQYIPSNTKYLIALPDEGSEKLVDIILKHIKPNYLNEKLPIKVKFDDVKTQIVDEHIQGAAVIVGSCISNGKNLLYLSRALRPFDKLKLIYFVGLTRTNNVEYLDFLKSNLKQGYYGKESNSFIEVENFYCAKESKNTTWIKEKDFIKELLDQIEESNLEQAKQFLKERVSLIDNSLSSQIKGLANQLFYPNAFNAPEELDLRKNFAFFNFIGYVGNVSQADVYFTISSILNNLRCNADYTQGLKQSEYVRNIIDPGNFNRFNDGIIQASILRSAYSSELSYHIDDSLSNDMKGILEKIIDHHKTPQGEGLIEFLYAISVEKLTLKKEHLAQLLHKIDKIDSNDLIKAFSTHIKENILENKPSLHEQIELLKNENKELKDLLKENGVEVSENKRVEVK